MVRNIEFKNVKSSLQHQLQNDVNWIKQDTKLLIPADKTSDLYILTKHEYKKLLTENISKICKKTDKPSLKKTNTEITLKTIRAISRTIRNVD